MNQIIDELIRKMHELEEELEVVYRKYILDATRLIFV